MADTRKKFYGVFDAEGVSKGFYVDDIYPPNENGSRNAAIPASAVEITEETWTTLLSNPATARYLNGSITYVDLPPPPPPAPTSEQTILYDHENRIRAQEGAPPLSMGDFVKKLSP
jgi:hypothetical protein